MESANKNVLACNIGDIMDIPPDEPDNKWRYN